MTDEEWQRVWELEAEIERLRTQLELHKQNNKDVFATCEAEIERLRTIVDMTANRIEKVALDMPPPNEYTPIFMAIAVAARSELTRCTHEQRGPSDG